MSAQSRPILTLSVAAAATALANLFVTDAGALTAAGGRALGVARSNAGAVGQMVPVDVLGTAIVSASAAIAVGAQIDATAAGQAVTHGAGVVVARALTAAAAAGDLIEVLLIPN